MSIVPNHALRQLRAGKLAIGLGLRQARTVDTAQIAKTAGFDWLFIDCEHNSMDGDTAAQIAAASLAVGITPIVRVAGLEHWLASRMLDNGAQGIVYPHIDSAEEARRAPTRAASRPVGKRSMGGGLQQLGFASMPVGEAARIVNEETLVVAMIESPRGVANCEEIAAVPGIDALLIGTNDLCFEMGVPGQFNDERVADAYRKVIAACRKHGKFPGMGGMYTPELLERHIADGRAARALGLRLLASHAGGHRARGAGARLRGQGTVNRGQMSGPKVFLDYDQKALDDAYDQLVYAPNRDQIIARMIRNSALARERLGKPLRFSYGSSEVEALDVFRSRSGEPGARLHPRRRVALPQRSRIFLCGGDARARRRALRGAATSSAWSRPKGNLSRWRSRCAARSTGSAATPAASAATRQRIYVSGSSSGAHLAAVLATTDLPVKGYVLTSGMYDLRGPRLSKRSAYVAFTDEMEEALSPQRHLSRIRAPIVLVYGTLETPEFQRQSRDFAAALRRRRARPVELSSPSTTTTSRSPRRWAIPTGLLAARSCGKWGYKSVFPRR